MSSTVEDCKKLSDLLDDRFLKLENAIKDATTDHQSLYESMDVYQTKYMDARKAICTCLCEAKMIVAGHATNPKKEKKYETHFDKSLKPFILTKAHSPTDLCLWIKQVEEYFNSDGSRSEQGVAKIQSQHAHLSRSQDVEMLKMLDQRVTPTTPIFGDDGCVEIIKNIFTILYPIFYCQMTLFQIWQRSEDNTSYLERINRLSMEADFDTLDWEAFCLLHFAVMLER